MRNLTVLLSAEFRRQWYLLRTYWLNSIASQLLFLFIYLLLAGLSNIVTGGRFDSTARLSLLIGFLTWRAATGYMDELVASISNEARVGTLEQLWVSRGSLSDIVIARSVMLLSYYTLRIMLIGFFVLLIFRLPIHWNLAALPLFILTLINILGVTLVLLGLQLVIKKVGFISNLLGFLFFFLTGAFAPFPPASQLHHLSLFLPLTSGIALLRSSLIDDVTISELLNSFNLLLLISNTLVYLILGILTLRWSYKRATQAGALAHY